MNGTTVTEQTPQSWQESVVRGVAWALLLSVTLPFAIIVYSLRHARGLQPHWRSDIPAFSHRPGKKLQFAITIVLMVLLFAAYVAFLAPR